MLNVKIEILVSFCRCCCCHFSFIQQGAPCLNTFFVCFFLQSFSPFHAIVWQFSTCLCEKTNANRLKPTIYRCGKRNMQSFILARLYKKPSGFTGDCKKKNEEKKKCFKTINSSRLFPVHRIRWLFLVHNLSVIQSTIVVEPCSTLWERSFIHSRYDFILNYGQWNTEHGCVSVCFEQKFQILAIKLFINLDVHSCQKKVFDFCNEDFRENQFEPQKWMWNWWCSIEICMFEQMAKSERHLFLWNNVLFWKFIVFGRIYTWNIYLFSCDCRHFINFKLKTMFSLWSILFGRFTIYFSYTFLVLRIQKWTRRTRNVKFN